ncbi:MAG: SPASM domain-containing protein [Planctomycetes bacterium]|nr:SPASM domain-containing protein [Planctomycetota bacterium]
MNALSHPWIVNLELTNHCPMKCAMCPRTYEMSRNKGYMDINLFKKIINDYSVNYVDDGGFTLWLHHFGESLMHPHFDTAIKYPVSKGIRTGISVNPIMLDATTAERLLSSHPNIIYLMLDGDDEESFYRARGIDGIYWLSVENAVDTINLKNKISPETIIQITLVDNPLWKDSLDRAEKFWREAHQINILRKEFWVWNGGIDAINAMCEPNGQESICQTPWNYISITWDGLVVPCCADFNNLFILGDLNKESIDQVWNGSRVEELRAELSSKIVTNNLCGSCPYTAHIN